MNIFAFSFAPGGGRPGDVAIGRVDASREVWEDRWGRSAIVGRRFDWRVGGGRRGRPPR